MSETAKDSVFGPNVFINSKVVLSRVVERALQGISCLQDRQVTRNIICRCRSAGGPKVRGGGDSLPVNVVATKG